MYAAKFNLNTIFFPFTTATPACTQLCDGHGRIDVAYIVRQTSHWIFGSVYKRHFTRVMQHSLWWYGVCIRFFLSHSTKKEHYILKTKKRYKVVKQQRLEGSLLLSNRRAYGSVRTGQTRFSWNVHFVAKCVQVKPRRVVVFVNTVHKHELQQPRVQSPHHRRHAQRFILHVHLVRFKCVNLQVPATW